MGRMIHSSMWEDEFFTSMSLFDKLLWIGLITVCADDQGRLQDSLGMIRAKIFPVDDITLVDIGAGLDRFHKDGKIERYIAGKHKCIQIVNWWKHQKPQWAGRSIYPPCEKWVDRERFHTTKNEIINTNWNKDGGFPVDYIGCYIAGKVKSDVKVKSEGEGDVNGEGDSELPGADSPSDIQLMLEKITGIPPANANDIQAMVDIENMHPFPEDIQAAFDWVIGQGNNVHRYSSLVGPIRTSIAKRVQKPKSNQDQSMEAIKQFVEESDER